jgi:CheY-like chemotaxis protein
MNERKKLILLVEDDPDHVELALLALKKNNFSENVLIARDGSEALELLGKAELPELVLLDLKLPKVSGLEVLRRIRADERTRFLPVVVLSSSDEESDIARSYELGVNSYIVKPLAFENFTEAARHVGIYWLTLNKTPMGGK